MIARISYLSEGTNMKNIARAKDMADLWVGGWGWESKDVAAALRAAPDSRLAVALLTGVYAELKAIRELLSCANVSRGFQSMRAIERLAREFWVKPRKRAKAKQRSMRE